MNIRRWFLSAAALLMLAPGTAQAGFPVRKADFRFDPRKAYILVRVGPAKGSKGNAPFVMLSRMDPQTRAIAWGPGKDLKAINGEWALAGGRLHFDTQGDTSSYLIEVDPGYWIFFGPAGASGPTAMSLGTYGFTVRPGEITYAGTVYTGAEDGKSPIPEIAAQKLAPDLLGYATLTNLLVSRAMLVRPPKGDDPIATELKTYPMHLATLDTDIRFANHVGGLVNRAVGLPPMQHEPVPAGN